MGLKAELIVKDQALKEFSGGEIEKLRSHGGNFFASYGFAAMGSNPTADRAWVRMRPDRGIESVIYYSEAKALWLFKGITVLGYSDYEESDLRSLFELRRARFAEITLLNEDRRALMQNWPIQNRGYNSAYDNIIDLPDSPSDYLKSLGKSTRSHLPGYLRRVKREFGDRFVVRSFRRSEISSDLFHQLVDLSRKRLGKKGVKHLWVGDLLTNRFALAREAGMLCGLFVDDRLVAGTLQYLHHRDAYLYLIGHDPDLDRWQLGNLVLWITIDTLIAYSVRQFHLLWGKNVFYKTQFGAEPRPLFKVIFFESRLFHTFWPLVDRIRFVFAFGMRAISFLARKAGMIFRRLRIPAG
jgi:hypothetical protein